MRPDNRSSLLKRPGDKHRANGHEKGCMGHKENLSGDVPAEEMPLNFHCSRPLFSGGPQAALQPDGAV